MDMKKRMNIIILIFLLFLGNVVIAVEADDSIDSAIKREYNTSNLPALPKTSPKSVEPDNIFYKQEHSNTIKQTISSPQQPTTTPIPAQTTKYIEKEIPKIPQKINVKTSKVKYGQKFKVKINTAVSDKTQKGTKVTFTTEAPVVSKIVTLPTGTIIYGTVVNSHSPQALGNGGLVSIKADYIVYQGKTSYCEGNITNLNHKTVLFNNIKGDNGYFKGIYRTTKAGRTFYAKSVKVSKKLWNGPFAIISPITYLPGATFLVLNSTAAPFIAIFSKGDRVNISKGTKATIKLTAPAYIEY
jgi:hypothetical protein